MFNGVPDHLHQFIASRAALTVLPPPPSLPLHVSPPTLASFDPFVSHQLFQPHHLLHQLHHQSLTNKNEEKEEERVVLCRNLETQGLRSLSDSMDPWSNDEVHALLRIRSNMENWFPDFTWEHVSRKLEELGFKRSAEKCKGKFEEESRYCSNNNYNKNYRIFGELEAVYNQDENPQILADKMEKSSGGVAEKMMRVNLEENSGNESLENPPVEKMVAKRSTVRKRKRHQNFELLKRFCEEVVNRMMLQQEELHCKFLEDVKKRDEERLAREEAWRQQEMERLNKDIERRAHEQTIAFDRQAKMIEFLEKFISTPSQQNHSFLARDEDPLKPPNNSNLPTSPHEVDTLGAPSSTTKLVLAPQNQGSDTTENNSNVTSSSMALATPSLNPDNSKAPTKSSLSMSSQTPIHFTTQKNPPANPSSLSDTDRKDNGKRWPKHEVDSLISLRCNLYSSVEDKEGSKAPLWEKVSQGMLELGYKRSAKRCKEKWENINKYFRKTKDANKKRSSDSKTCTYFNQLSSLYNQGTLLVPSEAPENHSTSPRNRSESLGSSQCGGFSDPILHVDQEGERNTVVVVQVPSLEFEF